VFGVPGDFILEFLDHVVAHRQIRWVAAQLTIQELGTFVREGLTPAVVVATNDCYAVERAIHGRDAYYDNIMARIGKTPKGTGRQQRSGLPAAMHLGLSKPWVDLTARHVGHGRISTSSAPSSSHASTVHHCRRCRCLVWRLRAPSWLQRWEVAGAGIGWFVAFSVIVCPAAAVLVGDYSPAPVRQWGCWIDSQFCRGIDSCLPDCA
jgi:hypothetical protein